MHKGNYFSFKISKNWENEKSGLRRRIEDLLESSIIFPLINRTHKQKCISNKPSISLLFPSKKNYKQNLSAKGWQFFPFAFTSPNLVIRIFLIFSLIPIFCHLATHEDPENT